MAILHACDNDQFIRAPARRVGASLQAVSQMLCTCRLHKPKSLACTRIESFVSGCSSLLASSGETLSLLRAVDVQSSEVPGCELT